MKKISDIIEENSLGTWKYDFGDGLSKISTINFSSLGDSFLDKISEFYIWWEDELPKLVCNSHPLAKEFFELGVFSHFMYSEGSSTKKAYLGIGTNSNPYHLIDCEIFKFSESRSGKERYINVSILQNPYTEDDLKIQIDYQIDLKSNPKKITINPTTWLQKDSIDNIFDRIKSLLSDLIKESIEDRLFWLSNSKVYAKEFIKDIPDLKEFIIYQNIQNNRYLFSVKLKTTLAYFRVLTGTRSVKSLDIEKGFGNFAEIVNYEIKTWEDIKAIISNEILYLISQIR